MAKGRRYGSTHHDRLMGSYGYRHGGSPRAARAGDLTELLEEDVWSMLDRMVERENSEERRDRQSEPSWAGKGDDDGHSHVGGLSRTFQESSKSSASIMHHFHQSYENDMAAQPPPHVAASAPMNVPRWPRAMVGVESGESLGGHEKRAIGGEDEDDGEGMPPHEYLARKYEKGRRKAVAMSVFEGVGRTLKGRDMRRVRDAVWSRTGFDG
ncbi:hypothetical protein ACLOJK_039444 [Asimina triloba]